MTTGQSIRRIRQKKGLTQWQLSKAAGVTPGKILLLERDMVHCGPDLISAIAKALNVDEDAIGGSKNG